MTFSNKQTIQLGYSSWLREAEWDPDSEELTLLTKKDGFRPIVIEDVDEELFQRFRFSTSAGRFYHRHLKDRERIDKTELTVSWYEDDGEQRSVGMLIRRGSIYSDLEYIAELFAEVSEE